MLLAGVDDLERQIAAIDTGLRPLARTDQRAQLLASIAGAGGLLALTIAAEQSRARS